MTFGQIIKKLRRDANITQEKLAEYLNVSPQAVSRWETDITMPEISLLPPIANLFNVTTDYLLGVDIFKKNERIKEIYREASLKSCENTEDRYKKAITIIRNGLKLYPDSWILKESLISYLFVPSAAEDDKEYLKNLKEMNGICEDILAFCPDRTIQSRAIYFICSAARHLNNKDRAIKLAKSMPHYFESREYLITSLLDGDELTENLKDIVMHQYIEIASKIGIIAKGSDVGTARKLYNKYLAIQYALYENDDYTKACILGSEALTWVNTFVNIGDYDTAFDILYKEFNRINEIANEKLTHFSALVPAYISNQIEKKDLAERQSDLCFTVRGYIKILNGDLPNIMKEDKRYKEYIDLLYRFISKYEK